MSHMLSGGKEHSRRAACLVGSQIVRNRGARTVGDRDRKDRGLRDIRKPTIGYQENLGFCVVGFEQKSIISKGFFSLPC